VAKSLKYL